MNAIVSGVLILFIIAVLVVLAWRKLQANRFSQGLIIILVVGAILRVVAATDPYLHAWDERYHALVAKNLASHPLEPTLHEHLVLEADNTNWVGSNVWLGKPSFPLWIMAGSISVFGNTLFAIRLPSILLSLLAIGLTFLIGRKLFDERVALLAAFFHAFGGRIIELSAGRISSDHVELCFVVMAQLAIYFALQSSAAKKPIKWILLTGLFMGLAFLSKWYPALLVLPVWAGFFLSRPSGTFKSWVGHGLLLIATFLAVISPWTFYMLDKHPIEMEAILFNALNAYSVTVESHSEPFYYYWYKLIVVINAFVYVPLVLFIRFFIQSKDKWKYGALLTWALIPVIVFSFADTKRFTYLLISAPGFFVIMGWAWFYIKENYWGGKYKWMAFIVLVGLLGSSFHLGIERTKFFKGEELIAAFYSWPDEQKELLTSGTILFGTDDYIEIMFHTDVYASYRKIPSVQKMNELVAEGFIVLIHKEGKLSPYVVD